MRRGIIRGVGAVAMFGLVAACLGEVPEVAAPPGPTVSVTVATLSLSEVGDVVWDIEVVNGDAGTPDVVWQQRVASSRYGDGRGSASYVGPCDATPGVNANTVRLWVVGVYSEPVTTAGAFASGAVGDAVGVLVDFQNPTTPGTDGALTRVVACADNADRPVRFDVALMRPARQGFFDIAVNFNDIFCAAKFDCCDVTEAGCPDIALLHDGEGERSTTLVLGFACTAGAGAGLETALYLDGLALDCTAPSSGAEFAADMVIDPSGPEGNQCTAGDVDSCPAVSSPTLDADDYLYQVALYRGIEQLPSGGDAGNKLYWNAALGVVRAGEGSVGIEDCRLRARGTADDRSGTGTIVGGEIPAGTVYPYIQWDVDLGSCQAESLSFGEAGAVRTSYTPIGATAPTSFGYGFGPSLPAGPVAAVPGLCGEADGGSTLQAPAEGLCASGLPTAVAGDGPYLWECVGEHGGATAICSADRSCAGATLPWSVGEIGCDGAVAAAADGATANATDADPPTTGSQDFRCEQGVWAALGEGTCVQALPDGMSFVAIPAGTFTMGSPTTEVGRVADETQHQVTLTRGFAMQTTEVTQGQWKALSGGVNPSCFQTPNASSCSSAGANDTAPVERVNWYAALGYANALSVSRGLQPCYTVTMTGCTGAGEPGTWQAGAPNCTGAGSSIVVEFAGLDCTGYRLPTEAEWEYAARAGTTMATYGGSHTGTATDCTGQAHLDVIAWWCKNAGSRTRPVAGKTPNAFGLYDMLGNVWEWTWDWNGTYPGAVQDPLGPETGSRRIRRGGSWEDAARHARAASRNHDIPKDRRTTLGFRLVKTGSP